MQTTTTTTTWHHLVASVLLKVERVEEDGSTNQGGLLRRSGVLRKVHLKRIGIRKDLHSRRLWFLENLSKLGSLASVRLLLIRIKDPERNLATSPTARVSFGKAIHAAATTTRWRMNVVHLLVVVIKDIVSRNAVVARLFDSTHGLATRGDDGLLVAAALAGTDRELARTFDRQEFCVRTHLGNGHLPGIAGRAAPTFWARRFFKTVGDLLTTDKVLEL